MSLDPIVTSHEINIVSAEPVAAPRRTFLQLVRQLVSSDDDLAAPDFDPKALIGDIRDKVDDIDHVLKRMEVVEEWLRRVAAPLTKKAAAIGKNRERLRAYVAETMHAENLEMVPGHSMRVALRESPPGLTVTRAAVASDMLAFPGYVRVDRQYVWDYEAIKAELAAGKEIAKVGLPEGALPEFIPAHVTRGVWPDFKPNVPESIEKKKKLKKAKEIAP